VIPCTVQQGNTRSNLKALVNTRATSIRYIHRDLARNLNLRQTLLPYVIYPTGFTRTVLDGGEVSHTVTLRLQHDNHVEILRLYVTNTSRHELILGQPWMNKHRVNLDYANEKLVFTARRCTKRCLKASSISAPPQAQWGNGYSKKTYFRTPKLKHVLRQRHDHWLPKMKRQLHELTYDSDSDYTLSTDDQDDSLKSQPKLDIYCIGAAPFMSLARKRGYKICAVSIANINKALAVKKHTDPLTKVPPEYHDLIDVFSRENSDKLPVRRPYDHKIELIKDKQHGFGLLYGMS
jgi:hypothetical protein